MSTEYVAGFIVGFLLVFVAIFVVRMIVSKKLGGVPTGKCNFDERQELVRGKAFKYGFFTMMACNIILGFGPDILEVELPMANSVAMFLSLAIGLVVFASYAIWNEGYFSLNERPKSMMILFGFIAVVNTISAIMNYHQGKMFADGKLTFFAMNAVCAGMFVLIFIVLFAKSIARKHED